MKAETADYLAKARATLAGAQKIAIATTARFIDTITQVLPPGLTPAHGPSPQP